MMVRASPGPRKRSPMPTSRRPTFADAIRAAVRISDKIQKRCEHGQHAGGLMRRGKTAREPIAQRALTAGATSLRNCYWLPGLSEFDSAKMRRLSNEIGSRAKRAGGR